MTASARSPRTSRSSAAADEPAASRDGTQSIDRVTTILKLVSVHSRVGVMQRDLVALCGFTQPTVHRLLNALVRAGLVEYDEKTRRYHLGTGSHVLGMRSAERFAMHHTAIGSVVRLALQSEDTAFLTIRVGNDAVCVHREEGKHPIRAHVLSVGDRSPLGSGGGAIALLAAMEDEEINAVIAANAARYEAHCPALTPRKLRELVNETRANGYAINRGLVYPGSWGMGIVLHDERGLPGASLSIGAIESRMTEARQQTLVEMLKAEVRIVERRLKSVR